MREYQRCRAALAAGLGVAPSAETEALRRTIRARPPTPAADRPSAREETSPGPCRFSRSCPSRTQARPPRTQGADYFVRGFTEDVVSALARFRSLRVISAQSSFAEADLQASPREIGEGLGAHYLLWAVSDAARSACA
jgi:hypothetical protein